MIERVFIWALDNWIGAVLFGPTILGCVWGTWKSIRAQQLAAYRVDSGIGSREIKMSAVEIARACRAAVMAYSPEEGNSLDAWEQALATESPSHGMRFVRTYSSSGVDVCLLDSDNTLYLAIRGTEGLHDLLRDLRGFGVRQHDTLPGEVHSGFLADVVMIYRAFEHVLRSDKRVIVCGHSMGAAEAIELAALCEAQGCPVGGVVALCAPRSGKAAHARNIEKVLGDRILRFTVSRDIVPMVPPGILGWRHTCPTRYFDRNGKYHADLTIGFRVFDVVMSMFKDLCRLRLFRGMIGPHSSQAAANLVIENLDRMRLAQRPEHTTDEENS